MHNVIAVFDNEADLERALSAIGEQGIEEENFFLVRGVDHKSAAVPGGAGAAVIPGAAPDGGSHGLRADAGSAPQDTPSMLDERLGNLVQNRDQLAYYANVVEHDGNVLAVRVQNDQVDGVTGALRRAGATHIDTESDQ